MLNLKRSFLSILLTVVLIAAVNHELSAQKTRIAKVSSLYDSLRTHKIEYPKTVLAIAIYETGWLQCKDCALKYNNLFGFRTNKDFLKFSDASESIKYLRRWQTKYYLPWKRKNPNGTYYDYLTFIGYCDNMESYIKNIKSIENWLSLNVEKANN